MNQVEQHCIIEEICDTIRRTALEREPRLPKEWNGVELRQWIQDLAAEHFCLSMTPARRREYKNTRLTLNL
jgi:hypothetical protein